MYAITPFSFVTWPWTLVVLGMVRPSVQPCSCHEFLSTD